MNQRRLWLLSAELAEAEKGDTEEGRAAQRDAHTGRPRLPEPDPVWQCLDCPGRNAALGTALRLVRSRRDTPLA